MQIEKLFNPLEELLSKGSELSGDVGEFFTEITPWVLGAALVFWVIKSSIKVFQLDKLHAILSSVEDPNKDSDFSKLFNTSTLMIGNWIVLIFMCLFTFITVVTSMIFLLVPFYVYQVKLEVNYFAYFAVYFILTGLLIYLAKNLVQYINAVSARILVLRKRSATDKSPKTHT